MVSREGVHTLARFSFFTVASRLKANAPESIGVLQTNLRQMENRLNDRGTGILELAAIFERTEQKREKDETGKARAEEVLRRVQEGGDVDKDLRVLYWNDPEDLAEKLKATIVSDMEPILG